MSLTVTDREIDQAVVGESFQSQEVSALLYRSLPLAMQFINAGLARQDLKRAGFIEFGSSEPETMKQVAKLFASDALRTQFREALSAKFGYDLQMGFQLCCKVGFAIVGDAEAERKFNIFTSFESQVLAQRADLVDC